jgi:hypothetical protein
VTVIEATAYDTDAVYEVVPDAKEGVSVPPLRPRLERVVSPKATAGEYRTTRSPDPPLAPAALVTEEPLVATSAAPPPPPPVFVEPATGAVAVAV